MLDCWGNIYFTGIKLTLNFSGNLQLKGEIIIWIKIRWQEFEKKRCYSRDSKFYPVGSHRVILPWLDEKPLKRIFNLLCTIILWVILIVYPFSLNGSVSNTWESWEIPALFRKKETIFCRSQSRRAVPRRTWTIFWLLPNKKTKNKEFSKDSRRVSPTFRETISTS